MNMLDSTTLSQRDRVETFSHTQHSNRALIMEALVLLVFIAASVALIIQLFVTAGVQGADAHERQVSMQLASNAAETFAAAPASSSETRYFDAGGAQVTDATDAAYTVDVAITGDKKVSGTLYRADITVLAKDAQTYTLSTERYLSTTGGSAS